MTTTTIVPDRLGEIKGLALPGCRLIECGSGSYGRSVEFLGAGKVSIAPHIDDDRCGLGVEPCVHVFRWNGGAALVHAQFPRRVERCAVVGPGSQEETAYSPEALV